MSKEQTINDRFLAAQKEFKPAKKDATNPHFKSKYSTLKAVQDAVYPALNKHGISVHFAVVHNPETHHPLGVKCQLRAGEEYAETMVPCNFSGTPQQQMSAMTYAKRAALSLITGVVLDDESDDDGNEAVKVEPSRPSKPTFKHMMGKIKNCPDLDKLDKMQAYVEENSDTSKDKLLEMIEERRHDLASIDSV